MDLYTKNALECSKSTTQNYSTSFSLGVKLLAKRFRNPIHAIYGFVRFADEIVDTFHDFDKKELLNTFKTNTYKAIKDGISMNPILHSFQWVVNKYNIDHALIDSFLFSMEMDLSKTAYTPQDYKTYIYGSAEVVGLMCLKVFTEGDTEEYKALKHSAMKLGEAFQKINFLRDIQDDYTDKNRSYFPKINPATFSDEDKKLVEAEIAADFAQAFEGIKKLNKDSRLGVYLAYSYYKKLFKKIRKTHAKNILERRHRISNAHKIALLLGGYIKHKVNMIN